MPFFTLLVFFFSANLNDKNNLLDIRLKLTYLQYLIIRYLKIFYLTLVLGSMGL